MDDKPKTKIGVLMISEYSIIDVNGKINLLACASKRERAKEQKSRTFEMSEDGQTWCSHEV